MMHFLWFLLIGLFAGWLAGMLTKGKGFGWVGNLIIGVLGSFLGGLLFRLIGLGPTNSIGEIICAVVGAVVLLAIIGWATKRR